MCWSVVFVLFDWAEGTGQKYAHVFQDRNGLGRLFACGNREQSFTKNMSEPFESILLSKYLISLQASCVCAEQYLMSS